MVSGDAHITATVTWLSLCPQVGGGMRMTHTWLAGGPSDTGDAKCAFSKHPSHQESQMRQCSLQGGHTESPADTFSLFLVHSNVH